MSHKSKAVQGVDTKDYQPQVEHEAGKHCKVDSLPGVRLHRLPGEQLQYFNLSHLFSFGAFPYFNFRIMFFPQFKYNPKISNSISQTDPLKDVQT